MSKTNRSHRDVRVIAHRGVFSCFCCESLLMSWTCFCSSGGQWTCQTEKLLFSSAVSYHRSLFPHSAVSDSSANCVPSWKTIITSLVLSHITKQPSTCKTRHRSPRIINLMPVSSRTFLTLPMVIFLCQVAYTSNRILFNESEIFF